MWGKNQILYLAWTYQSPINLCRSKRLRNKHEEVYTGHRPRTRHPSLYSARYSLSVPLSGVSHRHRTPELSERLEVRPVAREGYVTLLYPLSLFLNIDIYR